jgi:hypothetical protein
MVSRQLQFKLDVFLVHLFHHQQVLLHTLIVILQLLIEKSTSFSLLEFLTDGKTILGGIVVLLDYLLHYLHDVVLLELAG